jgi:hypothetical protein
MQRWQWPWPVWYAKGLLVVAIVLIIPGSSWEVATTHGAQRIAAAIGIGVGIYCVAVAFVSLRWHR